MRLLPFLLASLLGSLYIHTLLPGIGYSGDTAKFCFTGYVWGTAHASGYPTYLFLNHFFTTLLPVGTIAYRANLLSAVFSIIAALFLYRTLVLLKVQPILSFATCLTFGLSQTMWSQSVVAEVYTLHVLFISIVLYFFLKWHQTQTDRDFLLGCGFYALSFGNSLSMITFLPGLVYLVCVTNKGVFSNWRLVAKVLVFIVLGILQYSYSLWRFYDPDAKYLEVATPDLKSVWWAVSGAQFRASMFELPFPYLIQKRIPEVAILMLKEFFYLTPFALLGLKRLDIKLNVFLILCAVFNFLFAINLDFLDWKMYLLPNFYIIAMYLGFALDWFYKRVSIPKFLQNLAIALVLMFPIALFFVNLSKVDQHKNTQVADTAEAYLRMVKSRALIVSPGYDASEFLWYYLIGEAWQNHTDIYVLHGCTVDQIRAYLQENRRIYSPIQRIQIPAGLNVYCLGPQHTAELYRMGFRIHSMGMRLFRVSQP